MFIPYGFVKIQKLPLDLWQELKGADTEESFVDFILENKDILFEYIGSKDQKKLQGGEKVSWSTLRYLYGVVSSYILRGGGSKLTTWSLWSYSDDEVFEFLDLPSMPKQELDIEGRAKFKLDSKVLLIGGKYYQALKKASTLIHDSVISNIYDYLGDKPLSFEEGDRLIKENTKGKKIKIHPNLKMCGKVDFVIEFDQGDDPIFVPIDVNDLHGGLCWIDQFRQYYSRFTDSLIKVDKQILDYFVQGFISYFQEQTGELPKKILVCLDDLARWNQDNGLNYVEIKKRAQTTLKDMGYQAEVGLSYLNNLQNSIEKYKKSGTVTINLIDENTGEMTKELMKNPDLVVRIYRRPFNKKTNSFFTLRRCCKDRLPFVVFDPEEIRPAYYKENVHLILGNHNLRQRLDSRILMPDMIGSYDISDSDLPNKIISDVLKSGNTDFVLKLNEKTPYTQISAHFFCASNGLHKLFLQDVLKKIKEEVKDIQHVVVEPHYGQSFGGGKLEIRTVNVKSD